MPRTSFGVSVGVCHIGGKNHMIKESRLGLGDFGQRLLDRCEESHLRTTTGTVQNEDSKGVSKQNHISPLEAS